MKKSLLAAVTLFLLSCGNRKDNNINGFVEPEDIAKKVKLTTSRPENRFYSDIFRGVAFIPLETNKQSHLSFAHDFLYFDHHYFIKDNSQRQYRSGIELYQRHLPGK